MDQFYLGVSVGLSLAAGVAATLLLKAPLQRFFAERNRQRELDALFEATTRQQQLERWNRRRELYVSFRTAAVALIEEFADGGGRWASFYMARDLLRDVKERGAPPAALAARQMCFVGQMMLNTGFTEELSVKFDQALRRYDIACRDDLAAMEHVSGKADDTHPAPFDPDATDAVEDELHRRQINVLR
jgi:hypothetical protein